MEHAGWAAQPWVAAPAPRLHLLTAPETCPTSAEKLRTLQAQETQQAKVRGGYKKPDPTPNPNPILTLTLTLTPEP